MYTILLAGDGWGAEAALLSLVTEPVFTISVLTHDDDVLSAANGNNVSIANNFDGDFDLIVCAGWKGKIKKDVLLAARIINIHYSLLPAYRGLHSTVWAILNNEKYLGFTFHEMNEFFDDGPIVYQYHVENDFKSTAAWYMEHFNLKVKEVLSDIIHKYLKGNLSVYKQDKSKASWVGKRTFEDCRINFQLDIEYQKAFFRALTAPYPLPFFEANSILYNITEYGFQTTDIKTHLGRILNLDEEGLWISCSEGYIICKKIVFQNTGESVSLSSFKIGQFIK